MILRFLAIGFFIVNGLSVHAQKNFSGSISGSVKDVNNESLPGLTVQIVGLGRGDITDSKGQYTIKGLEPNSYTVEVSGIGYELQQRPFQIKRNEKVRLDFRLKEGIIEMNEVMVFGDAESARIEKKGFSVEAIETRAIKTQSIDLNKVLDRSAGVRVRRSGGMGSDFTYSLDGMSGKSIKFFVDGVPMDYFGSSYSINNLPISLINRIDIYKGVVPVNLGSDALGGAINLITNQEVFNFLEASYSIGSFNTHQTDIQGQWRDEASGFTARLSGFYNYSDNNYEVWGRSVFYADASTGFRTVNFTKENPAERFNDDFRTITGKLDIGYTNRPWADKLFIGLLASDLDRGIQTGQTMAFVYGEARYEEKFVMPSLVYKKENFIIPELSVNLFSSYSSTEGVTIDTTMNVYNWRNEIINQDVAGGEIGREASLFTLNEDAFITRLNTTYSISQKHKIGLNYVLKDVIREGEDAYAAWWRIAFTEPQSLTTHFGGLSLESEWMNKKLNTNFFLKYYGYNASLTEDILISIDGEQQTIVREIENKKDFVGGGFASSLKLGFNIQAKLSVEQAIRMPDVDEALGDGVSIINSPNIQPEKSFNFNVGLILGKYKVAKNQSFKVSLNAFYRDTEDQLLFTVLEANGTGQYQNVDKTLGKGLEMDLQYDVTSTLEINLNSTYLDIRDNLKFTEEIDEFGEPIVVSNLTFEDRVRNTPYFMANAGVRWKKEGLIQSQSQLSAYAQGGYVHEYFRRWPSLAAEDGKDNIPTQLTFDVGIGYTFPKRAFSVALDASNVLNEQVYDNFLLQKPGRAFFLKLRYHFDNF